MVDLSKQDKSPRKARRIWPDWYPRLNAFRISSRWKSIWQLINTLIPYNCDKASLVTGFVRVRVAR